MKTISIVIPTYNEEGNIDLVYERTRKIFEEFLPEYAYEILFIDNGSTDNSRAMIQSLCEKDKQVLAIFNAKNFGFSRSTFYGLINSRGDCSILLFADMQDPPELIPQFVEKWENGAKIVCGIKKTSKENPLMFKVRTLYYKIMKSISEIEHLDHFHGFGLYDSSFIQEMRKLDDPSPYLRGIVAELGFCREEILYDQNKREKGKTSFNFLRLYDVSMQGITSHTKVLMRMASMLGGCVALGSILIAVVTLVLKLMYWDTYDVGLAAILIGVFFLGAAQLLFIGLLGEYIMSINTRIIHRPLVLEERRINFK